MIHKNFTEFKMIAEIAIYFKDAVDQDEINEILNDLYTCYKESKMPDVVEFLAFWLVDRSRNEHNHWLDKRGMMLLALNSRC